MTTIQDMHAALIKTAPFTGLDLSSVKIVNDTTMTYTIDEMIACYDMEVHLYSDGSILEITNGEDKLLHSNIDDWLFLYIED